MVARFSSVESDEGYVYTFRAVETIDLMTARWAHLPYEAAGEGLPPHHQRAGRLLPRDLRRLLQAAGDRRVGVSE